MGAARGKNPAAALGGHAGTEAVAALPDELAGLICSLHGTSPDPGDRRALMRPWGECCAATVPKSKKWAHTKEARA
jgi:hypothetical protein